MGYSNPVEEQEPAEEAAVRLQLPSNLDDLGEQLRGGLRARRFVKPSTPDLRFGSGDADPEVGDVARLADRLVEAREDLAVSRARADQAEVELAAVNQRLMAARALVYEAQRRADELAEQKAWLEGRCDTLQDALEIAVNASWLKRLRWRRQADRTTSARR